MVFGGTWREVFKTIEHGVERMGIEEMISDTFSILFSFCVKGS